MVPWVELYAQDRARWEADFASAFAKLQELGVANFHKGRVYKMAEAPPVVVEDDDDDE